MKLAWIRLRSRARKVYLAHCQEHDLQDKGLFSNLRFHDLRHEATSRIADRVPNVVELSAITGHLDLNMLKRYYHTNPEQLAAKLG